MKIHNFREFSGGGLATCTESAGATNHRKVDKIEMGRHMSGQVLDVFTPSEINAFTDALVRTGKRGIVEQIERYRGLDDGGAIDIEMLSDIGLWNPGLRIRQTHLPSISWTDTSRQQTMEAKDYDGPGPDHLQFAVGLARDTLSHPIGVLDVIKSQDDYFYMCITNMPHGYSYYICDGIGAVVDVISLVFGQKMMREVRLTAN
jgi:hypothetical protein